MQYIWWNISREKQIQKGDATIANTVSKFNTICFATQSVKKF